MKSLQEIISNLQKQPYETRVRVLWGTVIVVGILLMVIWGASLKSRFSSVDTKNLINLNTDELTTDEEEVSGTTTTTRIGDKDYISIERVERTAKDFRIYFVIKNPTDNVINFSQASQITLSVEDQVLNPKVVTDRQNFGFVQKILSHKENFGILVFDPTTAVKGDLIFDHMSFDTSRDQTFKQDLELNFKDLDQPNEIRE